MCRDREDERLRVVGVLGPGREEEWPEATSLWSLKIFIIDRDL
jgi:hypothetical protein